MTRTTPALVALTMLAGCISPSEPPDDDWRMESFPYLRDWNRDLLVEVLVDQTTVWTAAGSTELPPVLPPGSPGPPSSVWARSADDVYVGADVLAHWDGVEWTYLDTPALREVRFVAGAACPDGRDFALVRQGAVRTLRRIEGDALVLVDLPESQAASPWRIVCDHDALWLGTADGWAALVDGRWSDERLPGY